MAIDFLSELFRFCEEYGASDIHLAPGCAPMMRFNGCLRVCKEGVLTANVTEQIAAKLSQGRMAEIGSVDGAISSCSGTRYRFNIYRETNGVAIALRRLDSAFRSLKELGLPSGVANFCDLKDGLVVVSGPTGSGKSTTLATLIDAINRMREGHIITIEDPVEYVHKSQKSLVNQREVGRDATDFGSALVDALREDPDVILVGEIREIETIRTAITAAETGHLVFTTLHSGDAVGAIERLVAVFPADEQTAIRRQLALVLRAILVQHLLPSIGGRVPACELLVSTPAVSNIVSSGRTQQLYSAIEMGKESGMITLDESLSGLYNDGKITETVALAYSKNPEVLRKRFARRL